MESKRDIGKLFRDNLEQLDYAPTQKVWEQIELDLGKKKKKRRFFLWFFFSCIVTGVIIGGFLYNVSNGNSFTHKEANGNSILNKEDGKSNSAIIAEENNTNSSSEKATVSSVSDENKSEKSKNKNETSKKEKNNTDVVKNNSQKRYKNKAYSNPVNQPITYKKKKTSKKINAFSETQSFAEKRKKSDKLNNETEKQNSNETTLVSDTNKNNAIKEIEKSISVDSLIAATNNKKAPKRDKKPKDSLAVTDTIAETKTREIIVAPYYGINYGSYFGDFNAISNNTVLEEKAEMKDTYGVLVRWMFDNKLGIQIGVGKINSSYFSTIEKTGYSFINTQNVATDIPIDNLNGIFANETKVKFTYNSSYFEVPFEAYYIVMDKKFGIAASLGISWLFAGKNSVFAESENVEKMKIGTLKTTSSSSMTTNAKLYLFYKITPSLQLDLYPTFQYQIMGNTDSSNYSNYYFSVRTGLSYKF
ncbi:MAG: hypothetical protein V4648_09250 [Bacteroidota bacterium]